MSTFHFFHLFFSYVLASTLLFQFSLFFSTLFTSIFYFLFVVLVQYNLCNQGLTDKTVYSYFMKNKLISFIYILFRFIISNTFPCVLLAIMELAIEESYCFYLIILPTKVHGFQLRFLPLKNHYYQVNSIT